MVSLCVVSLYPSAASAQARQATHSPLTAPTIAASVAAAADWASTHYALSNYRVRETNPFLRPFDHRPGQLVAMGAIMDGIAFSAWNLTLGEQHPKVAAAGLWGMAAFRAYLAIHNMRNTRRAAPRERRLNPPDPNVPLSTSHFPRSTPVSSTTP
jgi:hypothetical protein